MVAPLNNRGSPSARAFWWFEVPPSRARWRLMPLPLAPDGRRPERNCATRTASASLTPGGGGVNKPRGQRADKTQDSGLMT